MSALSRPAHVLPALEAHAAGDRPEMETVVRFDAARDVERERDDLARALDRLRGRDDGLASARDYAFAEALFSGWRSRAELAELELEELHEHADGSSRTAAQCMFRAHDALVGAAALWVVSSCPTDRALGAAARGLAAAVAELDAPRRTQLDEALAEASCTQLDDVAERAAWVDADDRLRPAEEAHHA